MSARILVVDDAAFMRMMIRDILVKNGFEVAGEAANGKEAVEIIKTKYFDLIVTDYNMPEMDGKQLTEYVRTNSTQSTIPILMVSSESDSNRLAAVQQVGVSAICDKPFAPDTVRELLLKMLA